MKETKFVTDKTYVTRDGRMARIYAIDGGGVWPIHGAIFTGSEWEATCWTKDGCTREIAESNDDLDGIWEDRPKRMVAWICTGTATPVGHPEFHEEDWKPAEGIGQKWIRADWLDQPGKSA